MKAEVLIVGAGPAGLAAALELRSLGVRDVLVVDREQQAGGVPRHCAHTGYGLRDLHRLLTGPAYAQHYSRAVTAAGVTVRTGTTLTQLKPPSASGAARPEPLEAVLTSAAGIEPVQAEAVLLATGCRERPRAARLVPGSRPAGVLTTGELQQRVYLHGERLTGRAIVVGAEHVSFSAVVTLAHAGAEVVALVTEQPRHQSLAAFRLGARVIWRAPVWTRTSVTEILGGDQVTAVRLRDESDGSVRTVPCDLVVFTGDWIPDYEHARIAGARMDPGGRGPAVDTALLTSLPRLFAAGNLVHPAETADVAALSGRHAAAQIARLLADPGRAAEAAIIPVTVSGPLLWISPPAVRVPGPKPARDRFVLRSAGYAPVAHLEVRQDGRLLHRAWIRLLPGRSVQLAAGWVTRVDPDGGPVQVSVV
jgi:thioredoxin reductase